jgi:hypothetical protein
MAAAQTYEPIATTTLGSAATSYTFSSIPGTYTDLVLVINGGASVSTSEVYLQFNSDTASSYSFTSLNGNGSTVASNRGLSQTWIRSSWYISPPTTHAFLNIVNLQNYSNTTTYKTVVSRSGTSSGSYPGTEAIVGLWRSTSAINSVKIFLSSTNTWNVGTTFTIYGIAAA